MPEVSWKFLYPKLKSKYTEIFLTPVYFLDGLNNGGKLKGKKKTLVIYFKWEC